MNNVPAFNIPAAFRSRILSMVLSSLTFAVLAAPAVALTGDGWASQNGGTTGGTGGTVVTVSTNANFRSYAESTGTHIIQVSGTINLGTGNVVVRSNKTIVGLSTTGKLIGNLRIQSPYQNVIVKNLTIENDAGVGAGDGISVYGGKNVWVDHCTFVDCADGMLDITSGADFVTVSWCKFYYTRDNGHNYTNLVGASDSSPGDVGKLNVTFHHNWYGTLCNQRLPQTRYGKNHVYNNYYNCPGNSYCIRVAQDGQILVQNNYFENVNKAWTYKSDTTNNKIKATGSVFVNTSTPSGGNDTVFTPPYSYTLDSGSNVKSIVMAGAGVNGDTGGGAVTYQAEDAVRAGGVNVYSVHAGYNGTGYTDHPLNNGTVTFNNLNGGTGGSQTLRIRFANGAAGARTGQIIINSVAQNITFNPTGSWATWTTQDVAVTLNSGTSNTVVLKSTGQDYGNIDQITRL